jgi:hypothetical protein
MSVRRYEIRQFDDVVDAGAAIRDGLTVEVSIVAAGSDIGRRVIDFLAGVAVTGSATMTRIERGVFSVVPVKAGLPVSEDRGQLISLPTVRPGVGVLGSPLPADRDAMTEARPQRVLVRRRDRPFW